MSGQMRTCSDCGQEELAVSFREGVCYYCCQLNQQLCDAHNIEHDRWAKMTDKERGDEIMCAADVII